MYNLIAHRGVSNYKYNENTKAAILESLNKKYIAGVEIDARITKDNKIVLNHDMTINRNSDGCGFVSKMSLKEIKKYNFGTKQSPSKISTLKEVLKSIKNNKIVLIEIKFEGLNEEKFIKYFYKTIIKYLNKNIYIMSFNSVIIKKLKKEHPNLRCGLLIGKIINANNIDYSYDFIAISSYALDKIRSYKKPLFVWALKRKKHYKKLQKNMPNNVYYIVDNPKKMI